MRKLCLLTIGLAVWGCKYEDPFDESLDIDAPVTTVSSLVYVDHGRDQLIFVDPKDDELEVNYVAFGDETDKAAWCMATRDQSEILVLKVPADAKQEDVEEQLFRYPADGDDPPVVYDVLAPFTSVSLSPDHRTAVLYFGTDSEEHLQNANQVGIVDLEGKGVRNLTLNGFGGRLSSVHFPGQIREGEVIPVEIGTHARDIAAFLAEGEIVLVDMADEVADQVAVRFDENVNFNPEETLLRPGDPELFPDPTLFIRSSFGSDVAMLTLKDKPDEMTGLDGFTALVSLIPVGGNAEDFVYHDEGGVPLLISVSGARLVFTDIRTQESFDVDLDGSASNVFLRDHETPTGTIRQAVAWEHGGRHLHTLELDGIQSTLGRKPSRLKIETGIDELVVLDNDRVLIGSGLILYVVDFTKDQVTPLTSQVAYDPTSSALDGETLYLGTPGQDWMSTADLTTLNPESMILDATIQSFHYLRKNKKVVLVHDDPTGYVTVTDADDPGRAQSQVYWGFLLDGVLDTAQTEVE